MALKSLKKTLLEMFAVFLSNLIKECTGEQSVLVFYIEQIFCVVRIENRSLNLNSKEFKDRNISTPLNTLPHTLPPAVPEYCERMRKQITLVNFRHILSQHFPGRTGKAFKGEFFSSFKSFNMLLS